MGNEMMLMHSSLPKAVQGMLNLRPTSDYLLHSVIAHHTPSRTEMCSPSFSTEPPAPTYQCPVRPTFSVTSSGKPSPP